MIAGWIWRLEVANLILSEPSWSRKVTSFGLDRFELGFQILEFQATTSTALFQPNS